MILRKKHKRYPIREGPHLKAYSIYCLRINQDGTIIQWFKANVHNIINKKNCPFFTHSIVTHVQARGFNVLLAVMLEEHRVLNNHFVFPRVFV